MKISSARLNIREFRSEDYQAIARIVREPEFSLFSELDGTDKTAVEFIIKALKYKDAAVRKNFRMAVTLKDTDEVIGYVGMDNAIGSETENSPADIGYLIDKKHWGKGFATEAASTLISKVFKEQNISKIKATVHPENTASQRVLEKLGYKKLPDCIEINTATGIEPRFLYNLSKEDHKALMDKKQNPATNCTQSRFSEVTEPAHTLLEPSV